MTTQADLNVMAARSNLQRAEEALAKEQREELIAKLEAVRNDLREKRARYLTLAGEIRERREYRGRLQHSLAMHRNLAAQIENQRPACADYLPKDPEVAKWRREHVSLLNQIDELLKLLEENPEPSTVETAMLERDISQLEYAEKNLSDKLNPGRRDFLKGGVFRVNYV